jgi:hypothetical protein
MNNRLIWCLVFVCQNFQLFATCFLSDLPLKEQLSVSYGFSVIQCKSNLEILLGVHKVVVKIDKIVMDLWGSFDSLFCVRFKPHFPREARFCKSPDQTNPNIKRNHTIFSRKKICKRSRQYSLLRVFAICLIRL